MTFILSRATFEVMDIIYKIAYYLSRLIGLYSTLICIRIMFTWIPSQNPDGPVITFFKKICDPYLNIFRSRKAQIGRIDFSPLLALMVLNVLQSILSMFYSYGQITIGIIIALVINGLWQYFISYIFVLLLILIAVRWFMGRNRYSARNINFINAVEPILYKPVHFVYNIFYNGKNTDDQKIVFTAFFFYLAVFIMARYGINLLIGYLCKL